ncbi:MAG: hypothetical protein OEW24_09175 [Chloroflexota bacterium]|nr:hypothetical protein [Chloroflexota bacterium]
MQSDGDGLLAGRSTWAVTPPGERDEITRTESFAFTIDGLDIETHPAPCPPERTCSGFGLTERFRFRDDAILLLERAGTIDEQVHRRIGPRAP